MPDREIDITVDRLIADLCIIRGKTPEFGTMKLYNCSTDCGQFSLSATDGDTIHTITIKPKDEQEGGDGNGQGEGYQRMGSGSQP